MVTVLLLVALRLALGCHFLYEGVWKITHPDQFAVETEGFLTGARGPLAGVFYGMVPDIDGRHRLQGKLETVEVEKTDAAGKTAKVTVEIVTNDERTRQWQDLCNRFANQHGDLKEKAQKICDKQLLAAEEYLAQNWAEIQAHFAALDRFEESKKVNPRTDFQYKRNWDAMRSLRSEAKVWLTELDARQETYKTALRDLLAAKDAPDAKKPAGPDPFAPSMNPFAWERMEQIRFAITWGLTAIGACLFLGLGTRPAAFGGALFMMFVVMSQPSYPGVVPADPPQLGHALLVNKDFIEMLALLLISSTAVGRWGGLDYFLDNFIVNPFLSKTVGRGK
jgi:uncharacterized membrane protein YphA (DoxX/SURF4 family)